LQTVVDVAEQFINGGVILYEVKKDGDKKEWKADSGKATDLPIAILVNQNSASGSEVLAGALQDYRRAPIIGKTTYGKGSVNVLYPLSDGSALYLTIERWLTPNGRAIEGKGIDPDYNVDITADDIAQGKDPQLQRALDFLSPEMEPNLKQTASLSQSV
jgi:carboxyl-terminal processing protease